MIDRIVETARAAGCRSPSPAAANGCAIQREQIRPDDLEAYLSFVTCITGEITLTSSVGNETDFYHSGSWRDHGTVHVALTMQLPEHLYEL